MSTLVTSCAGAGLSHSVFPSSSHIFHLECCLICTVQIYQSGCDNIYYKTLPGTNFVVFVAPLNASLGWRGVCVGTDTRKEPIIPMKIVGVFVEAFHFSFDFSQVGCSEGNFESAFFFFFFFNMKRLKKLCRNEKKSRRCLCSGFVTTVSEPARIKTPSRQEAARKK